MNTITILRTSQDYEVQPVVHPSPHPDLIGRHEEVDVGVDIDMDIDAYSYTYLT